MTTLRNVLFALIGFSTISVAADEPASGDIKVMTYNIRYGTAKDGENHWDKRKKLLIEKVKAFNPDLFGTQETLAFQRDFLTEQLSGHEGFGVGRDDGKEKGEMMALYWRKDRFEKMDGGHFWYSETPDVAGSKSWDTSLPRMATWVKLKDKSKPTDKPILFVNTHFDHMGRVARAESAKLLRSKIESLGKGCSIILTGDFNSGEGSEPYKNLFGMNGKDESPVFDAYREAHPKREPDEGTSTPFKAAPNKGNRIDWIAVSRDWKVISAEIDRSGQDGRAPSDHFPITALLRR